LARRRSFVAEGASQDDGQVRIGVEPGTSVTVTELVPARNFTDETFQLQWGLTTAKD
jgi:hypothetical protein